jgi:membrane-associated phospholipid phosphatase
MYIRNCIRKALPIDIITAAYLLITGIYIIIGYSKIDNPLSHLLFRAAVLALILGIVTFQDKLQNGVFKFIRLFYPFALLGFIYSETDALNNVLLPNLDPIVAKYEAAIFGGHPSIWFYQAIPWKWFIELMNLSYFSYYVLIVGICLWLYFKKSAYTNYAIFIICCTFYLYYIIFILIPVVGPQFYFEPPFNKIPDAYLFSKIMNLIEVIGERPTAAFPSSHVGIVCVLWYLAIKYSKPLLKWYIILGILLILSTVYIKAHYVIDVIAGILSAPALYYLSSIIYSNTSALLISFNEK